MKTQTIIANSGEAVAPDRSVVSECPSKNGIF